MHIQVIKTNLFNKKAVWWKADEVFKRDNPSMWIDTYDVDPNWVVVDASHLSTTDTQVNNLDSDQGTWEMGSQTHDKEGPWVSMNNVTPDIRNEEVVQVNEIKVTSD